MGNCVTTLKEDLLQRIGSEWYHGHKIPSRRELAKHYNVSPATVSNAIRELVQNAHLRSIPGKGVYVVDPDGQDGKLNSSLEQTGKGRIVALAGAYLPSSVQIDSEGAASVASQAIIEGIWSTAARTGCHLVLFTGMRGQIDIQEFRRTAAEGLVLLGGFPLDQQIRLRQSGVPAIQANRPHGPVPLNYVDYNNPRLMAEAADRLLDAGHRRVGVITSQTSVPFALEEFRLKWIDRFCSRGMAYPFYDYFRPLDLGKTSREYPGGKRDVELRESIRETRRLLDLPEPPTALFCRESRLLQGVLNVLEERSLRVPEDICLLVQEEAGKPLEYSGFRHPHQELGHRLLEHLLETITNPLHFVQELIDVPFEDHGSVCPGPYAT